MAEFEATLNRYQVGVQDNLDWITTSIFAHELPILVHTHGGAKEKVRFIANEVSKTVDLEGEYARLKKFYRRAPGGGPFHVEEVFPGGFPGFLGAVRQGGCDEVMLAMERRAGVPEAGIVGYLETEDLKAMLESQTLGVGISEERMAIVGHAQLRAMLVLAITDALDEHGEQMPLELDREIREAFSHLESLRGAPERAVGIETDRGEPPIPTETSLTIEGMREMITDLGGRRPPSNARRATVRARLMAVVEDRAEENELAIALDDDSTDDDVIAAVVSLRAVMGPPSDDG